MKKRLLFVFVICSCTLCAVRVSFAQAGEWTWVSGVNTTGFTGSFGTQGVPSITNSPPGLYEPCEWKDQLGNFWLYGGTINSYGDLWRYNPVTNEWTWMTGNGLTNPIANYGVLGVPSPTNTPGVRSYAAMTWTDEDDNLWMFGGYSTGYLNDLWKYDIATNEWTWMSGLPTINYIGSFGTQGVPSPSNNPPAICENACTWMDKSNNLWLFGGENNCLFYDDVWKYDIAVSEWTWMKGTSLTNMPPTYGTLDVPDSGNTPGGRWEYAHWTNDSIRFWTFAGRGSTGDRNDMWMYNCLTDNWTWMNGPNIAADTGTLGTRCLSSITNVPRSRYENRSSVTDGYGKFWFYGGGITPVDNDLWKYDPSINQWAYISPASTSTSPVYGTKGIPDIANTPGGRIGAIAWMDAQNNYWMYGGAGPSFVSFGDLWRFIPDSACNGYIGVPDISGEQAIIIYPNPSSDQFTIYGLQFTVDARLEVFNVSGEKVYSRQLESGNSKPETVNCKQFASGIYFVKVANEKMNWVGKFVKE